MTRKNLADVLLKILGISMCLNAIPSFLTQPLMFLAPLWSLNDQSSSAAHAQFFHQAITNAVTFSLSDVVRLGIGIYVAVKSRKISEFLFKNEEE